MGIPTLHKIIMTMTNGYNIEDLSNRELVTLLDFVDGMLTVCEEQSASLSGGINNIDSNIRTFTRGQRSVYDDFQEDLGNIYDAINELLINRWTRK